MIHETYNCSIFQLCHNPSFEVLQKNHIVSHTYSPMTGDDKIDRNVYDVNKLIEIAPKSAFPLPLPQMIPDLYSYVWSDDKDRLITPISVLSNSQNPMYKIHMDRIEQTDLSYPILIDPNMWLVDGMHRICKAFLTKQPTITVSRFRTWDKMKRALIDNRKSRFVYRPYYTVNVYFNNKDYIFDVARLWKIAILSKIKHMNNVDMKNYIKQYAKYTEPEIVTECPVILLKGYGLLWGSKILEQSKVPYVELTLEDLKYAII